MKNYNYGITKPCKENWLRMKPNKNGRYCAKCSRIVVDFSKMKDHDIINYLHSHSKEKTCGHFLSAQLDNEFKGLRKLIVDAYYRAVTSDDASFKTGVIIAVLIIASFVTGCNRTIRRVGDVGGPVKVFNDTLLTNKDSLQRLPK